MRILLDPAAADPAGGAPAAADPAKPAAPPAPAAPDPNKQLLEELAAMRARVNDFEAKDREREEAARKAAEDKAREKGDFDKILADRDKRIAEERTAKEASDRRSANFALESKLATALARYDLVEDAAADLLQLWKGDFEAVAEGDGFNVRSKDRRPVDDIVRERLTSKRYEHYVKSTAAPGGGTAKPTATPTPDPNKPPQTYDEVVAAQMKAQNIGNFRAPVTSTATLEGTGVRVWKPGA